MQPCASWGSTPEPPEIDRPITHPNPVKKPQLWGFFCACSDVYMHHLKGTRGRLHLYLEPLRSCCYPLMSKPRVYSYLRFSDPRQASGHSVERQTDYARRWAEAHGLELDESLTMRDEGLSAYHQRHVTQGALGIFLAAVAAGRITPGSVLIVEGLDRLSRAEPMVAQGQLSQIIGAGITVVTASDNKTYSREQIKAQPMDLIYSLLVMIRAHEESDTKSKRVKAAIRRACESWIAGQRGRQINNGKDPAWVRWTGDRYEIVEAHAAAIREAVRLYRLGEGAMRIMQALNQAGAKLAEGGTAASHLYKLLRLPALYGTKRLTLDGETYLLDDYYPALMSRAEWDELQHLLSERVRRRGRGEIVGLITGSGRCFCGYCGSAVVAQNTMTRSRKPDGTVSDGNRRLICYAYAHAQPCPLGGSVSVVPVERAILNYCSDEMRLHRLLEGDNREQALRAQLSRLHADAAQTDAQLTRLMDAMLQDDAALPTVFVRKARELEQRQQDLAGQIQTAERELAALARAESPTLSESWADLAERALEMDREARLRVRQLVIDTFARIDVYMHGTDAYAPAPHPIMLKLSTHTGKTITLQVHRKTGEWESEQIYENT